MKMDVIVILFALVTAFLIRAWKMHGRFFARDRWALITGFVAAVTGFAIASLLINWVVVPVVIWLIAVGVLAVGVVGAVLRWPVLAWFAGAKSFRRAIAIIASLFLYALIIGVAFI